MAKIHTLQDGYRTGDLSVYPEAIDNKETLYEARNNATTKLKQSLSYSASVIVVESTEKFPDKGVLKVSNDQNSKYGELVYYGEKTQNTFKKIVRGFAGSIRSQWNINSTVSNSVSAEHHNSIKDAIIKLEVNLGLKDNPYIYSLNGILQNLENKFLITKPIFRAYPRKGPPPLTVTFQNFSTGPVVKYFWDFGDGNTSSEKNPIHTYYQEGTYTVELNVVGVSGGQGISTKNNYIVVSEEEKQPFFYIFPLIGKRYNNGSPTVFQFVDQTNGNIKERIWNFGGEGYLVKKMYDCTFDNSNSDYTLFIVDNKIFEEIDNTYKCIVDIDGSNQSNLLKNIVDIKFEYTTSSKVKIKLPKINESLISPKLGFYKEESISQYTEYDPNVHYINFIYNISSTVSPSIFILFKNQTIKKSFLKEEILVQ